jgi:tubulin-specific chaperone cofactor E-like protein
MPRLEFVNLSLNRLTGPIDSPCCRLDCLRSLVLNNTKLEWHSVESLLNLLPILEELHLSLNEYTHVLIDTLDEEENSLPTDLELGEDEEDDVCTCNANAGQSSSYARSN